MSRVNYENVVKACEKLVSEGLKPSGRSVTNLMGGGSPNSVLGYLREWKSSRPDQNLNAVVKQTQAARISEMESKLNDALARIDTLVYKIDSIVTTLGVVPHRPVPPGIKNLDDLLAFVGHIAKTTNMGWLEVKSHYHDLLEKYDSKSVYARFKNTRGDIRKRHRKASK